jgi:NAD(P)-dependent dehydrogenase (short-subunit alcohol dehydrogenase family)
LRYAQAGWAVILAARNPEEARRNADDIATRGGGQASVQAFDVLKTEGFAGFIDGLPALPETVVSVIGELGDQARAERDLQDAATVMRTNFEGPALLLSLLAERFVARGSGTLVGGELGCWRPRAGLQLRLWIGKGRFHGFLVWAAQPAGEKRRSRGHREAWLRAHAHDVGDEAAAASDR